MDELIGRRIEFDYAFLDGKTFQGRVQAVMGPSLRIDELKRKKAGNKFVKLDELEDDCCFNTRFLPRMQILEG
ncbi:MAG: hypothetical protein KDB68_09635 [Planctomycetes bacterium]|nr:hypothetical protein [Planctomycetota bacterium]